MKGVQQKDSCSNLWISNGNMNHIVGTVQNAVIRDRRVIVLLGFNGD